MRLKCHTDYLPPHWNRNVLMLAFRY